MLTIREIEDEFIKNGWLGFTSSHWLIQRVKELEDSIKFLEAQNADLREDVKRLESEISHMNTQTYAEWRNEMMCALTDRVKELEFAMVNTHAECERWKEDSHEQAKAIQRMSAAATDRNEVDMIREKYHQEDLANERAKVKSLLHDLERTTSNFSLLGVMNKHDVIRYFGRFPDKIFPPDHHEGRMVSKKWVCSSCGNIYESDVETTIPVPCVDCGGIGFQKR